MWKYHYFNLFPIDQIFCRFLMSFCLMPIGQSMLEPGCGYHVHHFFNNFSTVIVRLNLEEKRMRMEISFEDIFPFSRIFQPVIFMSLGLLLMLFKSQPNVSSDKIIPRPCVIMNMSQNSTWSGWNRYSISWQFSGIPSFLYEQTVLEFLASW